MYKYKLTIKKGEEEILNIESGGMTIKSTCKKIRREALNFSNENSEKISKKEWNEIKKFNEQKEIEKTLQE